MIFVQPKQDTVRWVQLPQLLQTMKYIHDDANYIGLPFTESGVSLSFEGISGKIE